MVLALQSPLPPPTLYTSPDNNFGFLYNKLICFSIRLQISNCSTMRSNNDLFSSANSFKLIKIGILFLDIFHPVIAIK